MSTRASRKRKLADTDLQPAEELNPNPSKRREATVGMMIGFLEELRRIMHPEKVVQKEVKSWKPKLQHDHHNDVKAYVVFLRYGSLTEPGPKWHTFRRIAEITGIKL